MMMIHYQNPKYLRGLQTNREMVECFLVGGPSGKPDRDSRFCVSVGRQEQFPLTGTFDGGRQRNKFLSGLDLPGL